MATDFCASMSTWRARDGALDFWPAEPLVDKWAEWAKINVALNFTSPVFWQVVRTAAGERDAQAIRQALDKLHLYLAIADAQIAREGYLAGHALTLADIQFGHLLYRYCTIAIERPVYPAIARYYERLTQRPAFAEHVMVSYDELRVP